MNAYIPYLCVAKIKNLKEYMDSLGGTMSCRCIKSFARIAFIRRAKKNSLIVDDIYDSGHTLENNASKVQKLMYGTAKPTGGTFKYKR